MIITILTMMALDLIIVLFYALKEFYLYTIWIKNRVCYRIDSMEKTTVPILEPINDPRSITIRYRQKDMPVNFVKE